MIHTGMGKHDGSAQKKFITAAHRLFAERGFYGVSLADVAAEIGLSKQAILHHFRTKEALYGAVLAGLAGRFEAVIERGLAYEGAPESRFSAFVAFLFAHMNTHPGDGQLIVRELLDNRDRAGVSASWYLRRFLDESLGMLRALPGWQVRTEAECRAAIYQVLGAVNYFAISGPTLNAIWGEKAVDNMSDAFFPVLKELILREQPKAAGTRSGDVRRLMSSP